MRHFQIFNKFIIPLLSLGMINNSCTKLDENLNSTLSSSQVSATPGSSNGLLAAAYSDLGGLLHGQDQLFSLQENTTDESLVPTRGGDWDDNGAWRVLHNHKWTADHPQLLNVFNNLNKLNFDATNVLLFKPSASEEAEARFLRAFALFNLLDLYGQYPFRNPGENLLTAPVVKKGTEGIDFIIAELNAVLPNLATANPKTIANLDAVRVLLMKCYLNKGAFLNRATPTFAASDLQSVITLGNSIMSSNKYSFTVNYFDNFSVDNDVKSKEGIFTYPNFSGIGANNGGPQARWNMTLHYNSYTPANPNAGWNGFSTLGEFYSSFGVSSPTTFTPADTLLDKRIGGRYYAGATEKSGLRPGLLVGQQFNELGVALKDRNGAPLAYTPTISPNMIETGSNKEVVGIRIVKYVPDYANYGGPAGNDLMIFRYADVVLMVAEAKQRAGDAPGALVLVNQLRVARGASVVTSMPLVNPNNVNDPGTLLAERGRELYWESYRRTDLIRFGVYLKPWGLKPTDDPKNLVFPIPNQALAANPNFVQNPGY